MAANTSSTYAYLVGKFTEARITSRHTWLTSLALDWLERHDYSDKIGVVSEIIDQIVIDYFVDIDRLKEFTNIERVNQTKIYSYLAYWILRRKPLQVISSDEADKFVFINENFVFDFLMSFVYSNPPGVPVVESQKENLNMFEDTLRYYLKYRLVTPQVIELCLVAFQAGRGYQYCVDYRK